MATGVLLPVSVVIQYFTNQGAVLAGGTINTFTAGTTTPINTYTDSTLGVSNGTSMTLDSAGRPTQEMWVAAGTTVKIIIKDSGGNQLGPTLDNIAGLNDLGSTSASNGPFWGGSAAGSANALTLTFSSGPTSYTSGLRITFLATANNSAATTVNVNGLGVKAIQNNTVALGGGEIINGSLYEIEYTGTAFQLAAHVADPVQKTLTQTITGAKTFSALLTASQGLTASLGATVSGAALTMSGQAITFANQVTVASAATTVLDTTLSNDVNISGVAAISAFTLANGSYRHCVATGAFSITTGGSLVIANYISGTAFSVGDMLDLWGEAGGVVRGIYTPVSGGVAGRLISVNYVTSSQTVNAVSGASNYDLIVVGGGAGCSGVGGTAGHQSSGGAPGGFSRKFVTAATYGASQVVTIGAAGTGTSSSPGGNGGTTSIGALLSATGGTGGARGVSAVSVCGAPGVGSSGDENGGFGLGEPTIGTATPTFGGTGASTLYGAGGARQTTAGSAGNAATGFGAGGGGCYATTSVTVVGGNGSAGLVIIRAYS